MSTELDILKEILIELKKIRIYFYDRIDADFERRRKKELDTAK
jgi:hypothetical protein